MPRVAGEQRFDIERLVGHHHEVDPGGGNVDARQVADVVHQLVDLDDDDAVAEGRRFDQRRGVFGARPGVDVAGAVGHEAGREHDVGNQVHHQPCVELDVGVDRADFQQAVFEQLADAQALGAGEREVELAGDAAFEQVQVLGASDAGHDHVQVMQLRGVGLGQGTGKEIRLLLVVAFEHHAVARQDQRLQRRDDVIGGQHHTVGKTSHQLEAPLLFAAPPRPSRVGGYCCCHDHSTGSLSWGSP
ncbi:hypothetical protein D3C71_999020 [compost metagenome]